MIFIEVLTQMYRMAGVLKHPGQGLSGSEQDEGLHIANALLDGLKLERLFFYQILRTVFDTQPNKAEYLVGALVDGADWEIERPEHILRAGYLIPNATQESEIPMKVLLDYTQFQVIVNKNVQSSMSWVLYYRPSLPVGTARLWPVPNQDFQVALYTPGAVTEFTDVMDTVEFPQGYREFMEYSGAVAVHDRYPDAKMQPRVEARALTYKARIKAAQYTPSYMRSDEAALGYPDAGARGSWGAREWNGY